jgi:hypothetical protein
MLDTNAELLEMYRVTPQTLKALVRCIDAEQAQQRPAPDSWSVVEVVAHLADIEAHAHERIRRMLAEEKPLIEGIDEQALAEEHRYHEWDVDDALRRFEEERAAHVETLEALGSDDWERLGHHSEFGDMTVESLTRLMAFHDAIHLAQIGRIVLGE